MANKYKNFSNKAKRKRKKKRGCWDKKRYITEEEALKEETKDEAQIYFCKYCEGYHRSQKLSRLLREIEKKGK